MRPITLSQSLVRVLIAGFFLVTGCTKTLVKDEIRADEYLKRCGDPSKLINREVTVSKNACIPAGLTRIITLGIWQWCPASVAWRADVKG